MKKSNKITLSVGIPAHNEEANIAKLLKAVLSQKQISYKLEKIYVMCDGCTDRTSEIVKKLSKKFRNIILFDDKKRFGKSERLNTIYKLNSSDLLLTLDADIMPQRNIEIERMVAMMKKHKDANVIGGRYVPVTPMTIMGWFSYVSYLSFEDAYMKLNSGSNYYALMGCASLLRKVFSKSFQYPRGTISDQNYLYAMATRHNIDGVRVAKKSRILFKTVDTFRGWRVLGVRSVIMDKQNIVEFAGKDILKSYSMPKILLLRSIIKWFLKFPLFTVGSVALNIYIRLFPLKEAMPKNGMWLSTESSKILAV